VLVVGRRIRVPREARVASPVVSIVALVALIAPIALVAGCSALPHASQTPSPSMPDEVGRVMAAGPTGPTTIAMVDRVVDGDTIVVRIGRDLDPVRYIGMDTPETVKRGTPVQWMGPEASAANKRFVDGRAVILEKDVSERDLYGRLLCDVWTKDGGRWTLVNLELVLDGFAQVTTYPPDVKYVDALLAAQQTAREADAGLWAPTPGP
jgi:endonuclease YncB( thermonuclease family)